MTSTVSDATASDAAGPSPARVLTVDDQDAFRAAARTLVEHIPGFELVGEAADGETAIRLAREVEPDMVVLDLRMDGLDGIETARLLRAEDPTCVIVLVSSADVRGLAALPETHDVTAIVRKQWLTCRLLRGLWVAHRRR